MSEKTTELIKKSDMERRPLENCHDGEGAIDFTKVYAADISGKPTAVSFIHDDILPPGVSIGYHNHADNEEYYYIISGSGRMQLDDEEYSISAGDIAIVYPGGSHGLINDSDKPLRILVVGASNRRNI